MEITIKNIDKLANLAKLKFSETEKVVIKSDLEKMVGFIEQLQQIDTTNIDPLLHISDAINVLRQDNLDGSISREEALLNAPSSDGQFFTVPKVIKK